MSRYAIICIGCLCCDTSSNIVGVTSSIIEAVKIVDRANLSIGYSTIHNYDYFEIPSDDFIDDDVKILMKDGKKKQKEVLKKYNNRTIFKINKIQEENNEIQEEK